MEGLRRTTLLSYQSHPLFQFPLPMWGSAFFRCKPWTSFLLSRPLPLFCFPLMNDKSHTRINTPLFFWLSLFSWILFLSSLDLESERGAKIFGNGFSWFLLVLERVWFRCKAWRCSWFQDLVSCYLLFLWAALF